MTERVTHESDRLPLVPMLALAAATFMSITIEVMPTGLMHLMAPELGVGESQIGNLVAIFAFTVVLTSAPLMLVLSRVPKRILLVAVLTLFALGTMFTAIAPNYALVVISRIVTGLAHGVFWASVSAYTAAIVPPQLIMRAVSITAGGGSLAFVFGMPLGTALGQIVGWRAAFVGIGVACLLVAVLLRFVLPNERRDDARTGSIDSESVADALRGPQRTLRMVILVCILTAVVMSAQYAFYSYISPHLLGPVGLPETWLPAALFGYGIAAALAAASTGALFSSRPVLGFYLTAALMASGGGLLTLVPGIQPVALIGFVIWGAGMGFMPVLLQSRLLAVAAPQQRDFAAALFNTGFNIGISGGSYLGGILLDEYGSTAPGGAFLVLLGGAVVLSTAIHFAARRRRRRDAAAG